MDYKQLSALRYLNGNYHQVDVINVNELDERLFQNKYVNNNRPLLIKGAVKSWPASKKWTSKFFCEVLGNKIVHLCGNMNFNSAERREATVRKMTMEQALKLRDCPDDDPVSIPHLPLDKLWYDFSGRPVQLGMESILSDVKPFSFIRNPKKGISSPFYRLFLYKNAGTDWHEHPVDEYLLSQISGGKIVGLISSRNNPEYYKLFEKFESEEYLNDPNFFEQYADKVFKVTVEEGDSLYVPPYWFHGIDTEDNKPGVTLVYSWRSPLHKLADFGYPIVRKTFKDALSTGMNRYSAMVCTLALVGGLYLCARRFWLKIAGAGKYEQQSQRQY
tara:strand:- start:3530 stop:4522 length:993 start_codon:yes stop_codon:yes gene_type:complete